MKLELKHLAPYLPYELPIEPIYVSTHGGGYYRELLDTDVLHYNCFEEIKPILRPLSDLTKEITVNGENFVPSDYISVRFNLFCGEWLYLCINNLDVIEDVPLSVSKKLLEWHFDIFGLIEKGLAIDINTIN